MDTSLDFEILFDARALGWLERNPPETSLVIAYSETRCCGGGRICDVRVRPRKRAERSGLARIGTVAGQELLLDRRVAVRLPRRLPMTVRGFGPFQGLALDLKGDEWARLLYA